MADKKISQLTALSAANLAPSTDVLAIVDTSATETKKIVAQDLINGVLNVASAVGIGTASPAYKLDVNGNAQIGNATAATNRSLLINGVVSKASRVAFQESGVDRWLIGNGAASENGNFEIYDATNGNNLIMTRTGNLGLGVTPSAWSGGFAVAQYKGGFIGSQSNAYLYTGQNAYFDGVNYKYIATAAATLYEQTAGKHAWYNAPSGTAGNDITGANAFVQAMTLNASGFLGVGATSHPSRITIEGTNGAVGSQIQLVGTGVLSGYIGPSADGLNFGTDGGGLIFRTGVTGNGSVTTGTERARITSGGALMINRSTQISTELLGVEFSGNNDGIYAYNQSATPTGNGIFVNYPNGTGTNTSSFNLYRGRTGGTDRFLVYGNGGIANYQSNNVDLSDARTKKDIAPAASMWDKIGALEIVTYKYNDQTHDDVNVGVIAQQVESVEPVWVDADGFGDTPEDGVPLKTVYTKDITFAAIKALQEAMARIESLEADMAALKGAK